MKKLKHIFRKNMGQKMKTNKNKVQVTGEMLKRDNNFKRFKKKYMLCYSLIIYL